LAGKIAGEYNAEEVKFIGAGREDVDVRMLGDGRYT
jgi:tRNA U54 and U55 pseudouridine synthase Pus10